MRSISGTCALALAAAWASGAQAQQQAQGFAVERLYTSAPGAGWFVMDDLRMQGGLGGAVSIALGYARRPLEVAGRLPVVSDQAFAEAALAVTYDRFRLSLIMTGPLAVSGSSGQVGAYQFTAPSAGLDQNPDTIADPRIGFEARILGEAAGAFRLGLGAQLALPSGLTADYLTDGEARAMARLLFAGDHGPFSWAGQLGIHLRGRDDGPVPDGPRGSEVLFGFAGGARVPLGGNVLVVGPEIFGETALRWLLGSGTTGFEALLDARLEGTRSDTAGYRFKLGAGAGLHPRFGVPAFRLVAAFELFSR